MQRTTGSASIKDVARHAGVSLGTVSNVLNHPELVTDVTRARVQAAINSLGYVRNDSARQLRAGNSRVIAYVALDASNPFFTDVAYGAQVAAWPEGFGLYLCNSNQDEEAERQYLELLAEQRVMGVLVTPIHPTNPGLDALKARGIPVVLVDRAMGSGHCSVTVDDHTGGVQALTHLLDLGHTHIAFVGGPLHLAQVADRLAGAMTAVESRGLPASTISTVVTEAMNVDEGRRGAQEILALPEEKRPTAAFCANDLLALGLLQEMTRSGVHVPSEMAIVGYDDIEFAKAAAVPLTSVRQPRALLGGTAVQLLLEASREPDSHVHRQVQFLPELVVRASTVGQGQRSVS